mgnify:CR=1 FL=1
MAWNEPQRFDDERRAELDAVATLVAQALERTQLPFDVTSEGTLTGDIGGSDAGEAPRFTIVLARRLP